MFVYITQNISTITCNVIVINTYDKYYVWLQLIIVTLFISACIMIVINFAFVDFILHVKNCTLKERYTIRINSSTK